MAEELQSEAIEAGEHYRIGRPSYPTAFGQGGRPGQLVVLRGEKELRLSYGATVRASAHTGYPGNAERSPPLVHTDVLQDLADAGQLEHLPTD